MTSIARVPKGTPTGGRFAATAHTESSLELNLAGIDSCDECGAAAPSTPHRDHGEGCSLNPANVITHAGGNTYRNGAVQALVHPGETKVKVGSRTPWGTVEYLTEVAPGIASVSTPGHGGVKLSAARNKLVHPAWRAEGGWYEEDCEWAFVAITFPDAYKPEVVERAHRSARDYFPDQYETVTGQTIEPGESYQRDRDLFDEAHRDDHVSVAASGFTDDAGNAMVRVTAQIGGRSKHAKPASKCTWIVTKADYDTRAENPGGVFIIDPDRHEREGGLYGREV